MTKLITELQSSPLLTSLAAAAAKSCAIFLFAWIASLLLRRRAAAVRHMLWVTASACSLAILVLPAALPTWKVVPRLPEIATVSNTPYAPAMAHALSEESVPLAAVRKFQKTKPKASASAHAKFYPASEQNATPQPLPSPDPTRLAWPDWRWSATVIWALGVLCYVTFWAMGGFRLRRLTRNSSIITQSDWVATRDQIAAALKIRRRIALLSSSEIEIPVTFGMLHPKIVLPADYIEWSAQRRNAVLRHEAAHIARWDALTHHLSQAACALYWFNPLARLAAKSARFERELACDDLVLAAGMPPSEYAGELLIMVSKFQRREHYAAALAMARRSQFEGRLLALLSPKQERGTLTRRALLCVALTSALVAIPLAAISMQDPQPPAPPAPSTQASPQAQSSLAPATTAAEPTPAPDPSWDAVATPAPAVAPRAEDPATPAPDGWAQPAIAQAPRADEVSAHPAIDRVFGVTGPNSGTLVGPAVIAITPVAPRASVRPQKPAVTPPPGRQTGLECGVVGGVNGGVNGGITGGVAGGVKGGIGGADSHHHSSFSTNDDGPTKSMVVNWSSDDCTVSLNSRGELKFTDDFSSIQSLSPDGFVEISSRIHGDSRRLTVHPTSNNGPLDYVWWVNGTKQPFDDAARKWVASFLIELDRHSAWAVKQRFPALLKEGGVQRVLDEVSYMGSDYARSIYLMTLVNEVNLKPQELIQTLSRTSELSSDYEAARVLMAIAGKYPLQDQASKSAFLAAIDGINSDYEHARVLMAFFDKGPIPIDMARTVLASASKLKSDYEHSRVLVEMATRGLVDASTQADFLASVNNIHSDYEHARSLVAYLESRKSDDKAVLGVIQSVPQIHSDYEAARVLTKIAEGRRLSGNIRDEYVKSAKQIRSEYERNRALEAVGYKPASI